MFGRIRLFCWAFLKATYVRFPQGIDLGKRIKIERLVTLKGGCRPGAILKIGDGTYIREGAFVSASDGQVLIGNHCLLAQRVWIGGRGKIIIHDRVLIGPNVVIVSSNHDLAAQDQLILTWPEIEGQVQIGSGSWIGANSVILPNVEIGENCIVGAGSVVTRSIPAGSTVAGNPAAQIGDVGLVASR